MAQSVKDERLVRKFNRGDIDNLAVKDQLDEIVDHYALTPTMTFAAAIE